MTQTMKPEQVREKFGPMFCKGLVTMVDEKNGIARIIDIYKDSLCLQECIFL